MLALLLWDMGQQSVRLFPKLLAVAFAVTFVLNFIHVLVTFEWSGLLAPVSQARGFLRSATWPPSTHTLPIAVGAALWRMRQADANLPRFAWAIIVVAGALFTAFQLVPTYLPPGPLGVTRPALIASPLLWTAVGLSAWRMREADPLVRPVALMAATSVVANLLMLYSRAPADGPAMAAHLWRLAAHAVLFLSVMEIASRESRERVRAEARLARLNEDLDQRVLERTAELEAANETLEREMKAHRDSQRLLEAIVETSPAVIYVKDLAGRYLLVNRRWAEIFHVEPAAMVGRCDHDIFPKEAADAFRAMDERVAAADQPITEEEIAPHDDGPHAYISVKSPLRDDSGQAFGIFGISTDITERKRAQEALAASEERTRLIIQTALDAVITMDNTGLISGWSPQAERVFGWTREAALGRPVEETIMPERYREGHRKGLARYLATGETAVLNRRIEIAALHRDGHEFPVELAITAIRIGDGVTFAGFVRDITERKQAEAKLKTQLERLALLDDITRAIGHRQDVQSIFQVVVRSVEDQLPADFACLCLYDGLDRAFTVAAVGVNSQALALELAMPERARIDLDENGLSQCMRGQLVYEPDIAKLDFPFPQRLAQSRLRSLVAAPLQVENTVFGILVVARSAAEGFVSAECEFLRQLSEHAALALHQAHLHGALRTAYDDLRQSQQTVMQQERLRALGQMASGIAHDINNALSPVALYTEFILETEAGLSPAARDHLQIIQRAVEDVGHTISRMREFYARRESALIAAPVQVNELVQHVLDLTKVRWRDMAVQRGDVIDVRTELASGLPTMMGVESEIRDALVNLVFNAVDALPQGGAITIRTSETDGAVRVEVADNGVGMDDETRRRCLEPFFTTKGERGTGLGLAMVYGVAQRHGGEIDIASEPGAGTTIGLIFTAQPAPETPARPQSASGTQPPRMRILLVDDDPVLLKALGDALSADGHMVTAANDGQSGIDAFGAADDDGGRFDVVITDLGMPRVDGRQVASAIKTRSPATPVLLLTGWGRGLLADNDIPPHVDEVLGKPPKMRELRDALARLNGGETP
ncbi:PAS domain S-box protein [Phenylobacterium sp. LjRoot225]|uniref:hybrid sensor histidine kinase/response regulator n=1 Tax=Phenylobacterium sp. LjRoot225 TaxID=3342285 RepID=UPI003ECD4247